MSWNTQTTPACEGGGVKGVNDDTHMTANMNKKSSVACIICKAPRAQAWLRTNGAAPRKRTVISNNDRSLPLSRLITLANEPSIKIAENTSWMNARLVVDRLFYTCSDCRQPAMTDTKNNKGHAGAPQGATVAWYPAVDPERVAGVEVEIGGHSAMGHRHSWHGVSRHSAMVVRCHWCRSLLISLLISGDGWTEFRMAHAWE